MGSSGKLMFPIAKFHKSYFPNQLKWGVSSVSNAILKMSTSTGDHLERTTGHTRDTGMNSMTIKSISPLSPTVKQFVLQSKQQTLPQTFKAGQWVDVFIPGLKTVGGFSMCSSPSDFSSRGELTLAIKYSKHPPALWMHEKCQIGAQLDVRFGGDFYLTVDALEKGISSILFIAGGIGVNPLCSMIHYAVNDERFSRCQLHLLYSARSHDELIFKNQFDTYLKTGRLNIKYFVTGQLGEEVSNVTYRRMGASDLTSTVKMMNTTSDRIGSYLCGPPSMITEMAEALRAMNVHKVFHENWW